jgi:hypothetical protein
VAVPLLAVQSSGKSAWLPDLSGLYLHDPHLIDVSLVEVRILAAAVALVVPDAARTQTEQASER